MIKSEAKNWRTLGIRLGKSRLIWVADLIKAKLKDEWPEDFFELAGSWEGEETPEAIMAIIRKGLDQADNREDLS
jgi:hypothetical protein